MEGKVEGILYNKPALVVDESAMGDIDRTLSSGWVSNGRHVEELESRVREMTGVRHVLACNNATQGLIIAMKAAGWRNMRVLAPAFTWPSTIYAIECNVGNSVVFGDVDRGTWHLDISSVNPGEYDAVLMMDTFGNQFSGTCDRPMIVDAAHGFGLPGLGHRGLAEVVSLSFTKIVTGTEGGLILTNDDSLHEIAKELRRLSSRMPEVNAIMALGSIDLWLNGGREARQSKVDRYLGKFDFGFERQRISSATNNSVFSILLSSPFVRDSIVDALKSEGIEFKTYYEPLVEGLPVTDMVYSRILSLPVYGTLTGKEQDRICDVINAAARNFTPGKKYLKTSGYLDKYIRNGEDHRFSAPGCTGDRT